MIKPRRPSGATPPEFDPIASRVVKYRPDDKELAKRRRIIENVQVLVFVLLILGTAVGLAAALGFGVYWTVDVMLG